MSLIKANFSSIFLTCLCALPTKKDFKIPVPANYVEFLELNYGKTYMQLPPEKDRYHIKFVFADLADNVVLNIDPVPGSLGEKEKMEKQI